MCLSLDVINAKNNLGRHFLAICHQLANPDTHAMALERSKATLVVRVMEVGNVRVVVSGLVGMVSTQTEISLALPQDWRTVKCLMCFLKHSGYAAPVRTTSKQSFAGV